MVDPLSYFSFFQRSTTGVEKALLCVCGTMHIKSSERIAHVAAASFLSGYLSGPLPYIRRHITVNKMC